VVAVLSRFDGYTLHRTPREQLAEMRRELAAQQRLLAKSKTASARRHHQSCIASWMAEIAQAEAKAEGR